MDQAPARRLQDGLLTMPGPTPDEIYACSELHVAGAAYLKKYGLMKHFGVNAGLMDEFLVNHPRNCVGADREPRGRAISKLELIKLWCGRTLMPMRHMYSWPVPTPGALALIKGTVESRKLKGVVEMGAGTGYWASLLKAGGIDVVAFDKDINGMKPGEWAGVCKPVPFHDVYLGGPEMLKRGAYCTRALFLCYPPPGDIMCDQALCNFEGDYVIYVGALDRLHRLSSTLPECSRAQHPHGVETGHPLFFMRLAKDWDVVQHVPLPSHFFCRDHLVVLERRVACRKAPRPEIHERLTPKWKGLSPEEASDHVRKIEKINWSRFEKEYLTYCDVHGLAPQQSPLSLAEWQSAVDLAHVEETGACQDGAHEGGAEHGNPLEKVEVDAAKPWQESLHALMSEYPQATTEKLHEQLVVFFPDLNKKTVKNARAKLQKRRATMPANESS